MGVYKDSRDYVDHDFNTTTVTVNSEHKVEGLEMLEVEMDEDEVSVQKSGDGLGIFVVDPSTSGTIKLTILEASATNDIMWALHKSGASFPVSVLDTAAPNLNCSGKKMKIVKRPVIKRSKEHDMIEWVCIAVYLKAEGGSYSLAAA